MVESLTTLSSEFDAFMATEQRRVFLVCLRMLRDQDEAESATQDAFLKAYRAFAKGHGPALVDPSRWIYRIAVNTCLDRLRSRRWQFWRQRPKQADEQFILATARSGSAEAEQQCLSAELSRRLADALGRLSGRQLAVFTLKHYEDKSLDEIGELLGLDTGTVKAHLYRAIQKLRRELNDLYGLKS